jgi:CRISPR-associated protein Cas2
MGADAPGSKDHPLLKRIEKSEIIWSKVSAFDEMSIALEKVEFDYNKEALKPSKEQKLEGARTILYYVLPGDVSTLEAAGRKRLRRVAKVCQNYGQRVQKSVFECKVDAMTLEILQDALLKEISLTEDNLRIYRLTEPLTKNVKEFGKFRATDFDAPLIL